MVDWGSFTPPGHPTADVFAVLEAIEKGEVELDLLTAHGDNDHPEYRASNGWRFRVFDDNGGWDYLDAFARPNDDWINFPESFGDDYENHPLFDVFMRYRPPHRALHAWHWVRNGVSPGGYTP